MSRRQNHIVPDDFSEKSNFFKNQDLSFDDAIRIFIQDAKVRNLSNYTIRSYQQKLEQVKYCIFEAEPDIKPKNIRLDHIKEHVIIRLLDEGKSETTVNSLLRGVRAFFNFLYNEGYININPVEQLKMLRENKKIVETFTREDLQILFAQPDLRTFTGIRDYTIMLLLLDTGIRVREACDITLNDINWKDNLITINGKGFKQRGVPLQPTMKRQLDKYVRLRGDLDTNVLFVTIDNTPITRRQVQDRIKHYGKMAGLKHIRVSPHTFRHTFAKMSIMNGANIFALQKILGHTTLEMVKRYVNMFSDEAALQHKKFSPVERFYR